MISPDIRLAWMIRSKQVSSSIRYWLTIVGYDSHDRSVLMRIYLLYLVAFFFAWILAVMFFLSNLVVGTLVPFLISQGITLADFTASLGTLFLILWISYSLYKATYQSPLVFSDDDAYLICQTPVSRRPVVLAWLLGDWPMSALPAFAGAGIASFALLELDVNTGIRALSLGRLAITILKPLSIIVPFHLGLLAMVWVVGVCRLQRDAEASKMMRLLRILILIFSVVTFLVTLENLLPPSSFSVWQRLFSLLKFPLDVAFHAGGWALGFAISIGLMITGIAVLWQISDNLNLSRAAQETGKLQAKRAALRLGDFDLSRELSDRERLGYSHAPSKIPAHSGAWMMTWKDMVQSLRTLTVARLWPWLLFLFLTIAAVLSPDGSVQFWVAIYWTLHVGQRTSFRLRNDLSNWWLLSSLPLPARSILLRVVMRPVLGIVAITWIAMWIGNSLGSSLSIIVGCAVPVVVVGISFAFVFDMLRQSDVSMLLAGRQPAFGAVGLVFGMLCLALPAAINFIIKQYQLSLIVGVPAVILAGVFMAVALLRLSERQFLCVG